MASPSEQSPNTPLANPRPSEVRGVYLIGTNDKPLEVRSGPYTPPDRGQVVVRNRAIAINPLDWLKRDIPGLVFPWCKYPFVLGTDVAGEVFEVGEGVTRFKVGDRVVGHAVGMIKPYVRNAEGTYQEYTILREELTSPIPDSMPFEKACVMPLALSTAACGLFLEDELGLEPPTATVKQKNETLLIWGGSTSVGLCAIQLAAAAGYDVVTTCSARNHALVENLGASGSSNDTSAGAKGEASPGDIARSSFSLSVRAFEYASVEDIVAYLKDKKIAGAVAIGNGSVDQCVGIVGRCKGKKFVAGATAGMPDPIPESFQIPRIAANFVSWSVYNKVRRTAKGVGYKMIFGCPSEESGLRKSIYQDFLPDALRRGSFVPLPEPLVVGNGVEHIQTALEKQKSGVSAQKVVVTLGDDGTAKAPTDVAGQVTSSTRVL